MIEITTAGQRASTWGEGPVWWNQQLYYVDIEGHAVVAYDPLSDSERTWPVGFRVGTVVPRAAGGLVIAGDHGIHFLDPQDGSLTPVCNPEPDKPNNRFNDGKASPDGHLFAGTISLVKQTGDARLYRLSPAHECSEAFGPVTNSNGLAWSPDATTLYYIDTPRREILAFDYSAATLANPRSVADTKHIDASPDGMTIDTNGNLWVAFCHGACVACFNPATGQEIHRVELPCLETTSCAFGGPNLADLYVTTGIHKSVQEPLAGRLLVIRNLGAQGLPTATFAG